MFLIVNSMQLTEIIALHVVCVVGFERRGSDAKSSQVRHAQLGSIWNGNY